MSSAPSQESRGRKMPEYQHSNGTWVVKNGNHLGFGATRDEAWVRSGATTAGRVDDIFLDFKEWEALIQFVKSGLADSVGRKPVVDGDSDSRLARRLNELWAVGLRGGGSAASSKDDPASRLNEPPLDPPSWDDRKDLLDLWQEHAPLPDIELRAGIYDALIAVANWGYNRKTGSGA